MPCKDRMINMIYSIKGKLIHCENDFAVIECAGVGYACNTTLSTIGHIQGETGDVTLYTSMVVREDDVSLYGFATPDELHAFKLLTSVSGVGPKAGLAILSVCTPQSFALAVASGDSKMFTKAKGVGPKVAQRIVLELKDKVSKDAGLMGESSEGDFSVVSTGNAAEAVSALVVLGYSQSEAARFISTIDSNTPVEDMIKLALKGLAGM